MLKIRNLIFVLLLTLNAGFALSFEAQNYKNNLVEAADQGDVNMIVEYLRDGNAVDSTSDFKTTALMRASYKGFDEIVNLLINIGADVNMQDEGGATALHLAAREGHNNIVKLLVADSAELNLADKDGFTPLMHAVTSKRYEIIESLLVANADVTKKNKFDNTPLKFAVSSNDSAIISAFVKHVDFAKLPDATKSELVKLAEAKNLDEDSRHILNAALNTPVKLQVSEKIEVASLDSKDDFDPNTIRTSELETNFAFGEDSNKSQIVDNVDAPKLEIGNLFSSLTSLFATPEATTENNENLANFIETSIDSSEESTIPTQAPNQEFNSSKAPYKKVTSASAEKILKNCFKHLNRALLTKEPTDKIKNIIVKVAQEELTSVTKNLTFSFVNKSDPNENDIKDMCKIIYEKQGNFKIHNITTNMM